MTRRYQLLFGASLVMGCFGVVVFYLIRIFAQNGVPLGATPMEKIDGVDSVMCGEFEQRDAPAGSKELTDTKLIRVTEHIDAKLGLLFGCNFQVRGTPTKSVAELEVLIHHPAIRDEKRETENAIDHWVTYAGNDQPSFAGWLFEDTWELVPGMWKLEVRDHGNTLVSKQFDVSVTPP